MLEMISDIILQTIFFASYSFGTYLILYFVFSVFELWFPAERGHGLKGRFRNILITASFLFFGNLATLLLNYWIQFDLSNVAGINWGQNMLWALLAIFIGDFFYYWYHRAQHTFGFLWPIHEVHHADTELNVTTSYRTLWLDMPVHSLLVALPMSLVVGGPAQLFMLVYATKLIWEFFTHANIRLHLFFLSPVFCGPQVHRIHHSVKKEHMDKNFAQYFPIYDVIFGTYFAPKKNEFPPTGTHGLAVDAPLGSVMVHPFKRWVKMLSKSHTRK